MGRRNLPLAFGAEEERGRARVMVAWFPDMSAERRPSAHFRFENVSLQGCNARGRRIILVDIAGGSNRSAFDGDGTGPRFTQQFILPTSAS
jgi:hypothetical protein